MAYDKQKLAKLADLEALTERVKGEIEKAAGGAADALRTGGLYGNKIKLYASADGSGEPAVTIDLPADMVLDQTRTKFIDAFVWSEEAYPGSENPSLDGKPVMVLAVKGENGSVSFSFLNMAKLVDVYKAKTEGKDASTTVEIAGYEIDVKVCVSKASGNTLQLKEDGMYVPQPDLSGKADKAQGAAEGNLAAFDASGNLTDSGKAPGDFSKVEAGSGSGKIKVDGEDVTVVEIATDAEVSEMLDGVFGAAGQAEG